MDYFSSATIRMEPAGEGVILLWIDVKDRSLNVVTPQVMMDLNDALDRLERDPALKLLIIRGAKSSGFLAGADIKEFESITNEETARMISQKGQEVFARLEALSAPTLAAIHGPCLGGGLELALACDYRVALDQKSTQLGLPEVELGLLPGWGGTQRLPRVVGLEQAFKMILGGKRLNAGEALKAGLIDALGRNNAEWLEAIDRVAKQALVDGKRLKNRIPIRSFRQRWLEANPVGRHLLFKATQRMLNSRVPDDMPAPWEAFEAVKTGVKKGMAAGYEKERQGAGKLALTPACRNLVQLFLQLSRSREQGKSDEEASTDIKKVGVVGAGVMGAGIAQLAALRGCEVIVQEINESALGVGMLKIAGLFEKAVERKVMPAQEAKEKLAKITGTTEWKGFDSVDLVVEAALEEKEAKRAIFRELDKRVRPGAALATNTSSLLVSDLLDGLAHPERVAGLHFFNPVHKMPLVEVIATNVTQPALSQRLGRWAVKLGKTPVYVKDCPGFIVNRVLMPYLAEAILLVSQKMPIEQVDRVMRRFGMPMGPLELLDQVGIDVAGHIARSVQAALGASRSIPGFDPARVFDGLTKHGWTGQKSGAGFYHHKGKKPLPNREAEAYLVEQIGANLPDTGVSLPVAAAKVEARERMVLLMVNEAAMILGEGLADSWESIDLAMVLGTGWAPHRGGPLHYAKQRGLADCVRVLDDYSRRLGSRFTPSDGLRNLPD